MSWAYDQILPTRLNESTIENILHISQQLIFTYKPNRKSKSKALAIYKINISHIKVKILRNFSNNYLIKKY